MGAIVTLRRDIAATLNAALPDPVYDAVLDEAAVGPYLLMDRPTIQPRGTFTLVIVDIPIILVSSGTDRAAQDWIDDTLLTVLSALAPYGFGIDEPTTTEVGEIASRPVFAARLTVSGTVQIT